MHRFNYIALRNLASVFIALIAFSGATISYAQPFTLTIRDGQVYVNGKQLPRDEIPGSLDAESIDASLTFVNPIFELEGNFYKIENDKLFDTDAPENADDNQTTVIFRNNRSGAPPAASVEEDAEMLQRNSRLSGTRSRYDTNVVVRGDPKVVMQQYVVTLSQNARQLNELSASLSQPQAQDLIDQVQYQAEQAAQLAQEMPYLEMQNYFSSVRSEDELLYKRLVSELELEREALRLAEEVRQLPPGDDRSFKTKELRAMLITILELKQENRRLEISILENQLTVLKQRFATREAQKDRMIDRRIKELVGEH